MTKSILLIIVLLTSISLYAQDVPYWPIYKTSDETDHDKVTSAFGPRDESSTSFKYDFHKGIDIKAPENTRVYASISGDVQAAGENNGYGYMVRTYDIVSGKGAGYAHLNSLNVWENDYVNKGDLIGYSGTTAGGSNTVAPHLHFNYYEDVPINITPTDKYAHHPMKLLPYKNTTVFTFPPDKSPKITGFKNRGAISNVQNLSIYIRTKKEELDFNELYFKFDYQGVSDYDLTINFDNRTNCGTDDQKVTVDFGDKGSIDVYIDPDDFFYSSHSHQVIEFLVDFSDWDRVCIYESDIKAKVVDIQEEEDSRQFFSPVLTKNKPNKEE